MSLREELNRCPVDVPPVDSEAERYVICPACDQAIDCRRLGDVLHHEEPGHSPIPLN